MDSLDNKSNICRICLDPDGVLNWNYEILGLCGETYKDCYYKYTQLEILIKDPYPQMLCETCAIDLKISHSLVVKALKSHAILQQTISNNSELIYISNDETDNLLPTSDPEFEMLVLEEFEEPLIKDKDVGKECPYQTIETSSVNVSEKGNRHIRKRKKLKDNDIFETNFEIESTEITILSQEEINTQEESHITNDNDNSDDCDYTDSQFIESIDKHLPNDGDYDDQELNQTQTDDSQDIPQVKQVRRNYDRPLMCSICSKMFMGCAAVRQHEKTHQENRERTTTCPECGVKLFGKYALHAHSKIHNQNREKTHKCEFCEKAYFNNGDLNIHRRIHLGQTIPCPICSKEYVREIDLKRHIAAAHTEAPLNTDARKQEKFYVYCKECDKQIRSVRWRAHQAAHLKEPLLKCSICDKEFFNRSTCTYHMRKTHNHLKKDDYEPYIIYLKPRRFSRLMMGSTPAAT